MTNQAKEATTAVKRANRAFVSAIGMLIVCSGAIYLSFSYFRSSERLVTHSTEVRAAVGDLESAIGSAGRARSTFLMSGSADDLNAYRAAASQIEARLQQVHVLIQDNPTQVANVAKIEALTRSRLQAWESAVLERQAGKAVDFFQLTQENVRLAADSAAITRSIRVEEQQLQQERHRVAQRRFLLAVACVAVSLVVALVLLYLYYRGLAKELSAREEAEAAARSGYERESTLRRELERFRLFLDAVKDYAIYVLDSKGHIASWNLGAERIKGYTALEILGKHFSCFFAPEDVQQGKPLREMQIAAEQGHFEGEGWRVRKDGTRFWANVLLTAIKNDRGEVVGFTKVTRDFTERMRAEEALQQANATLAGEISERLATENRLATSEQSLRELSHHLLRTQDEERRRIGRDLHDSLGQYLAMLKMNLDSLNQAFAVNGGSEGVKERLARSVDLVQDSIKEVRTISHLLYPPLLEEVGLKSAIPWYLEEFSKRSNIQTTFDLDPDFGRLTSDTELALFRILQESLTNVHRHSGSPTVEVRLSRQDETAVLEIRDRGKGMPPAILEKTGAAYGRSYSGVGLRGMSERMRQLGGTLEVKTDKGGTIIVASVPALEPMPASLTGT